MQDFEFDEASDNRKRRGDNNQEPMAEHVKRDDSKNGKRSQASNDSDLSDDDQDGVVSAMYSAKPINIQPGHTGFLTFATLLHKDFESNSE